MIDGKMLYYKEAKARWDIWKQAGKEPSYEDACAKIVEEALGGTVSVRKTDDELDNRLSFVYWDITENGRGALDYDAPTALINDLLRQAGNIVFGCYNQGSAQIGGHTFSYPESMKTPLRGRQRTENTTAEERHAAALRFIANARDMILKWKMLDNELNWPYIAKTLAQLYKEIRKIWKTEKTKVKTA